MTNRERIEDLGRIAERLVSVTDKLRDLEWQLKAMKPDACNEDLEELITSVDVISSEVYDAWNIARWGDDYDEE